jgi:hypothetical protein
MSWSHSWLEQLLLRRAPQDDVYSQRMLIVSLVAYMAVDLLQAFSGSAWRVASAITLTDTLVMVLFAWAVLKITGKSPRLVQTLTALAGTGALLGILGVPLVWEAVRAHHSDGPSASVVTAWLVLLVWTVAVQAHIFRHALSTGYGVGLMAAGLHSVIAIITLETLFPRVLETAAG